MRFLFKVIWIGAGFFMLGCLVDFPTVREQPDSGVSSDTDSDSAGKDTATSDPNSSDDSDSAHGGSDSDTDTDDSDFDTDSDTEDAGSDSETSTDSEGEDTESDTETEGLSPNQDRALYVAAPPVIDGDLSDSVWRLNTAAALIAEGKTENKVLFDALWDEDYLYVAVQVKDSEICTGTEYDSWFFDSVEIYVDPDMSKSSEYDKLDAQLIFKWLDKDWIQCGAQTQDCSRISFYMRGADTSDGYTVELRTAWSSFDVKPQKNMWIGFDIGVNDDDSECSSSGQSRDGSIRWQGTMNNYRDTSAFGALLLSGFGAD